MRSLFCRHSVFFIAFFIFLATSCSKKNELPPQEIPVQAQTFSWYAFTQNSFEKIAKLSDAPVVPAKPWTEAVRISSISCAASADKADGMPEGYAVVNRCGILVFKGDSVELCSDSALFSGKTAGNLVFFSDIPFFSVYRSTFFNDADGKKTQDFTPFLIQFTPDQRIFYPVVTVQNLGFDSRYEITDFIWDGTVWTCSAKASENEKTVFSYCTFQPKEPLYAITPENAGSSLLVAESSAVKFRGAQETLDFSNAPARIKELLGSLPETADFSLSCYTAGGHSPRVFVSAHNKKSSASQLLANALLSENWCGVLFEDGTFFLKGALFSRPVMNGGKPVALKLPKLLAGYVYSGFTVSGSYLYAAWEETSFFKTGRSGFICVDLDAVLYKVEK